MYFRTVQTRPGQGRVGIDAGLLAISRLDFGSGPVSEQPRLKGISSNRSC
jgi:hypothetical protein